VLQAETHISMAGLWRRCCQIYPVIALLANLDCSLSVLAKLDCIEAVAALFDGVPSCQAVCGNLPQRIERLRIIIDNISY